MRWLDVDGLTYTGLPRRPTAADRTGAVAAGGTTTTGDTVGTAPGNTSEDDAAGTDFSDAEAADWITLLRCCTPYYSAQAWQHLAGAYRSAGHELDAKRILIAQQDDRRARLLRAPTSKAHQPQDQRDPVRRRRARLALHRTTLAISKTCTGYGYQTGRAVVFLGVCVLLAMALGLLAGSGKVMVQAPLPRAAAANLQARASTATACEPTADAPSDQGTSPSIVGGTSTTTVCLVRAAAHSRLTNDEGAPCSVAERLGLGLEIGLPLIKTTAGTRCTLDGTDPAGQVLTAASWLLQALAWAFATLVITGYTGLIRRL